MSSPSVNEVMKVVPSPVSVSVSVAVVVSVVAALLDSAWVSSLVLGLHATPTSSIAPMLSAPTMLTNSRSGALSWRRAAPQKGQLDSSART